MASGTTIGTTSGKTEEATVITKQARRLAPVLIFATVIVAAVSGTPAQVPDEFTNLEVLQKDISKAELVDIMRGFAGALGVRCSHCHVGPDNLQGMDFATDEKATKRTARVMMKMVRAINESHLADLDTGRSAKLEVSCRTCHRGLSVPRPIEDVIAAKLEDGDIETAIAEYRTLRDEHYGSSAYDFSAGPVSGLAEKLARARKTDEAEALLQLNIEYHPEDVRPRMLLGGLYTAKGDRDKAIAAFREALTLDPDNGQAKKMIQALESESEGD